MRIKLFFLFIILIYAFPAGAEEICSEFINYFLLENEKEIQISRNSLYKKNFNRKKDMLLDTVLLVRLYQISPDKSYLLKAAKRLDNNGPDVDRDIYKALSGVVNGYLAREKKIFGMKNLKHMKKDFKNISDKPHWLVRFLRGMTLYQVCDALPEIPPLKKQIKEGMETAEKDFSALEKTDNIPEQIRLAYRKCFNTLNNGL